MYRYFLCLLILFSVSVSSVFASRTVATQHPYYNPYRRYYNSYQQNNFYNRNKLSDLERYTFNRNYTRESNLDRLQRLEMQAFGAIQQGDFDSRYENVRNAILSRPKAHTQSSVWRNIGDYFSGQMTGFTPPINTYPHYYNSGYGNSSFNEYSSPFGGHGFRMRNSGVSSGTGITILD